jgi:hypothetical protein
MVLPLFNSTMENIKISNRSELLLHIMHLKAEKYRQEEELKVTLKEFIDTLNPLSIVKESLSEMVRDKDVHFDLAKMGLNIGANFIIDQILGRNSSIKGFISAVLVENFSTSFINNNVSKIISGINKLIHRKPEEEITQD